MGADNIWLILFPRRADARDVTKPDGIADWWWHRRR